MDEAFLKLFAQHQRAIYAMVRSLCRRPQDADDIFQETVVVLWRKRDQFVPGSNFLAWATRVARYEVLAHAKRQSRAGLLFDHDLLEQIAELAEVNAESADARLQALRHCLGQLSPRQRDLIEQRYATRGSVTELAARIGRSVNSVSVTLHALRRKLLMCIEQRLAGEPS